MYKLMKRKDGHLCAVLSVKKHIKMMYQNDSPDWKKIGYTTKADCKNKRITIDVKPFKKDAKKLYMLGDRVFIMFHVKKLLSIMFQREKDLDKILFDANILYKNKRIVLTFKDSP